MAECSESIGRSQASGLASGSRGVRGARPRRPGRAPAASRGGRPRRASPCWPSPRPCPRASAARTGAGSTTPPVADDDEVDVVARRERLRASVAADALRAGRQVQPPMRRRRRGRPRPAGAGAACSARSVAVRAGRERHDLERVRVARRGRRRAWRPIEPGGAEERDAAGAAPGSGEGAATTYRVTTGAANRNESTRSSMPPCPGISVPGVLGAGGALEHRLGEVAGLRGERRRAARGRARGAAAGRGPRAAAPTTTVVATMPPIRPAYVFDGEMWVRNFGRPNCLPDEEGARVVRPDRQDEQQDPARARRRARQRRAGRDGRGAHGRGGR